MVLTRFGGAGRRRCGHFQGANVEPRIVTRLGDGSALELTPSEIRAELEDGTQTASARGKMPPLEAGDLDHLHDIFASRARFSAVDIGDEVVLSFDGSGSPQQGSRVDALLQYEQCLAADTCELYHIDYSYKAVKTVVGAEQQAMKEAQERVTIPVHYGAQPDLGRYSAPDGPCGNWSELLPQTRIDEAREAQEAAVELAVDDMVYVAEELWAAGADGINFDTAGAAGDADLQATLLAVERLRARHPDMGIMVGMAAEMVLGTHGRLEFHGRRLAGLKPAGQCEVVQEAGATVFGPAVNVNTSRTVAWNIARALTYMKPCMAVATVPVHANVGMGVGGVPMNAFAPIDAISRCSRACVDILRLDGL
jgi:dimethylamine---corrinoid protein Co-methyltransferase